MTGWLFHALWFVLVVGGASMFAAGLVDLARRL